MVMTGPHLLASRSAFRGTPDVRDMAWRPLHLGDCQMRRMPLLSFVLLGLSLLVVAEPALAEHSTPVLTYTPQQGPEGTVITFTIAGCKEAAQGPAGRPEADITISLFPSSFAGGDQRHFDIAADDEQVTGSFTVGTRAQYAASASGFDGRTLSLGVVCWEGGDTGDEFIITDAPQPEPTVTTTTSTTTRPTVPQAQTASPDTQSQAQVSDATVTPGEAINVSGGGFAPDRDVRLDFLSDPVFLGSTRSDSSGRFSITVTIPLNASSGPHRIIASGPGAGGGTHRSIATVNVVTRVAQPLARTGGTSTGLLHLGMVATLAGVLLLVCTERRLTNINLGRQPSVVRARHGIVWRGGRPRRWPLT